MVQPPPDRWRRTGSAGLALKVNAAGVRMRELRVGYVYDDQAARRNLLAAPYCRYVRIGDWYRVLARAGRLLNRCARRELLDVHDLAHQFRELRAPRALQLLHLFNQISYGAVPWVSSFETVLPRLIQKLKDAGCEESVVGLVIPTGYSFNLDGTCLYLATVAVFLAQATNTHLTVGHQITLLLVLLLTSKGAAGVAGAAFVVLAATLGSTGVIPLASIALVLGIHRILAEALVFVNVVGNCVATVVVARWEGALDPERLAEALATA